MSCLAVGRSDLFFRLEVIKKILTIINIAITIRWGIFGLIYGMIVFSVAAYYLNSYYVGKLIRYPFKERFPGPICLPDCGGTDGSRGILRDFPANRQ